MKEFATFHIPVSPHVLKFMRASFGESYHISQDDFMGMMLAPLFTNKVKINRRPLKDSKKTEFYPVTISYDFFERQGCFLSHEQYKMVGRILDKYFREMLFSHLLIYSKDHPTNHRQGIVSFCETFGITIEDIDPQTLYRDFYRKKEERRNSLIANLAELVE